MEDTDEEIDEETKKMMAKQLKPTLTPKNERNKGLLSMFQDKMKLEIDKRVREAKEEWDRLEAERLTDG